MFLFLVAIHAVDIMVDCSTAVPARVVASPDVDGVTVNPDLSRGGKALVTVGALVWPVLLVRVSPQHVGVDPEQGG